MWKAFHFHTGSYAKVSSEMRAGLETNIPKLAASDNAQPCTGEEKLLHTKDLGLATVGPDDCSSVQRAKYPPLSTGLFAEIINNDSSLRLLTKHKSLALKPDIFINKPKCIEQ